ncbi:response regulator transcription factor [Dongia sp.]|uniref:response regulator transcription factor n=1 Tax=Dongia sp. TaxID=1977262 RepID=UPI0035AFAAC8
MSHQRRILLVDDDEALRKTLAEQLALDGEFACVEAGTAGEVLAVAQKEKPDAILLDVGLPDGDGRQVCEALRKAGISVPIIMVTASSGEADTIRGLDMGANDYISKPFRLGELLARLRAHLRQHEHSEDALIPIGPYIFKPNVKMLVDEKANKKIRLTEKETAILKYLYRAEQRAVGRETLLGEVWGYNAGVTTHTLETHVYRLRQKIEKDPAKAQILITDAGGYKLVP